MADTVNIEIEGIDALLKQFEVARRDRNRVSKQAMGDAAKACAKELKSRVPRRWKEIIRSKAYIASDGTVGAAFGLSKKVMRITGHQPKRAVAEHERSGSDSSMLRDWIKAYWVNYGTYSKRDPNHKFKYARKKKTSGRGSSDPSTTQYRHFFEKSVTGFETTFNNAFDKAIDRRINDLFK